jgi:hypothetical protein
MLAGEAEGQRGKGKSNAPGFGPKYSADIYTVQYAGADARWQRFIAEDVQKGG